MKTLIRILLVDDHSLVRDGVEAILQLEKDIKHIDHASSCAEALASVNANPPDIVLLDRRMPEGDGFDFLEKLQKLSPNTRVIMMTASVTPHEIELARELGAAGYLSKSVRRAALIGAIRTVLAGSTCFEARLSFINPADVHLTRREIEVLENLKGGRSNNDIAKILGISEYTVKSHLKVVFTKLCAANRSEAITRALELGILSI
jgi:DNA-binding NarL/FixJ family response regulator